METKKRGRPKKEREMNGTPSLQQASGPDPGRKTKSPQPKTVIEKVNDLPFFSPVSNLSTATDNIVLSDFNGDNCEISIENWLDRFEELANLKNPSEARMIVILGNFLKIEALEWYMITKKHNPNLSYDELRELFIRRFGVRLVSPITEFIRLKYDPNKGILDYYKNKRRLATLAELSESHIISLVIEGLPSSLTSAFISVIPRSMHQFLEIASRAEMNHKMREYRVGLNPLKRSQPQAFNQKFSKKRKPSPCRICENMGLKNQFHWSSDCYNRENLNKRPKLETSNEKQPFKKVLN